MTARFTIHQEFNSLAALITVLKAKQEELSKERDELGLKKSSVLKRFIEQIDGLINEFNKETPSTQEEEEQKAALNLLIKVMTISLSLSLDDLAILCSPRSNIRSNLSGFFTYGGIAAGTTAGFLVGGPFLAVAGFLGGRVAGGVINSQAGLNQIEGPDSLKKYLEFVTEIAYAIKAVSSEYEPGCKLRVANINNRTATFENVLAIYVTEANIAQESLGDVLVVHRLNGNEIIEKKASELLTSREQIFIQSQKNIDKSHIFQALTLVLFYRARLIPYLECYAKDHLEETSVASIEV